MTTVLFHGDLLVYMYRLQPLTMIQTTVTTVNMIEKVSTCVRSSGRHFEFEKICSCVSHI